MANHKSATKEHRQSQDHRERNRSRRARLRTEIKRFRQALHEGDADAARTLLPGTLSLIDHTARHGAIHGNMAARTKSRLTRALNRLGSSA